MAAHSYHPPPQAMARYEYARASPMACAWDVPPAWDWKLITNEAGAIADKDEKVLRSCAENNNSGPRKYFFHSRFEDIAKYTHCSYAYAIFVRPVKTDQVDLSTTIVDDDTQMVHAFVDEKQIVSRQFTRGDNTKVSCVDTDIRARLAMGGVASMQARVEYRNRITQKKMSKSKILVKKKRLV